MARFVKRHLSAGAGILEVGCGVGANLVWLTGEGYLAFGIDVSPAAVAKANRRTPYHSYAMVGDATNIPYENNTFDCVVDITCLEHVREIDKALSEIYRVLKPRGWFFSVMAAQEHSDTAFPAGVYIRKLVDSVEAFYLLRKHEFEEFRAFRAFHEHEVYGEIAFWLLQGQKLAPKG